MSEPPKPDIGGLANAGLINGQPNSNGQIKSYSDFMRSLAAKYNNNE